MVRLVLVVIHRQSPVKSPDKNIIVVTFLIILYYLVVVVDDIGILRCCCGILCLTLFYCFEEILWII